MSITGIRAGDIVQVDDGLPYYGKVLDKSRGSLTVQMLSRTTVVKTVKSRSVVAHWRKSAAVSR